MSGTATDDVLSGAGEYSRVVDFFWDVTRDEFSVTPGFFRLLGCAPDGEPSWQCLLEHAHPDDRASISNHLSEAASHPAGFEFVFRTAISLGEARNIGVSARLASGAITAIAYIGTIRDLDDLSLNEQKSHDAEARLKVIVDTIPAIVWSSRADGGNDFHNQRLLDYTGFSPSQAAEAGWLGMVHPDDAERHAATWQRAVAANIPFECESRLKGADGNYRWFLARAEPLRDDAGRIAKWYGTNVDINDRRTAEQALKLNETYLAEAQRLSRTGSFGWCQSSGEFFHASEEVHRIFGFEDRAVLRRDEILKRIHPDDVVGFREAFQQLVSAGALDLQCRLRMENADIRHIHIVARAVSSELPDLCIVGAVSEITERILEHEMLSRLQMQLAHADRLSVLGELMASISHEIAQPLSAIAMSVQAGQNWLRAPRPDLQKLRKITVDIGDSARRAIDILQQVRTMATRGPATRASVSLDEIVQEVVVFLRYEIQERRIRVRQDLGLSRARARIMADRTQIQQVLINLLVNAMQAIGDSSVREIGIRTELSGGMVSCSVEDTGKGIENDVLPGLLDSFFTTKEGGMGLGLTVCRSILQAHGGSLLAGNREDGTGARFVFTIPADRLIEAE